MTQQIVEKNVQEPRIFYDKIRIALFIINYDCLKRTRNNKKLLHSLEPSNLKASFGEIIWKDVIFQILS